MQSYLKYIFILSVLCTGWHCSLEEDILDEVTGANLLESEGAELNIIAPVFGNLLFMHNMVRSSVWGLNEASSDELILPCRERGDWCEGPDQELHEHQWNVQNSYIEGNWQNLEQGISRANTALFFLQNQEDSDQNRSFQAEVRFLRAYHRFWQLDFYRQVPFRDEADLGFGTPPSVIGAEDAFRWIEEELQFIFPLLKDINEVFKGRVNKDASQFLLAKLYLNAEVYLGIPHWEEALQVCETIINTGQYALGEDYFDLFSTINQNDNPEAIFVIPQSMDLEFPLFYGPAWTLHYGQSLGINTFTFNGFAAGTNFFNSWDPTDSRFQNERLRANTGANLGFLVGPQFNADGSPIEDDARSNEADSFVQLSYVPEISTMRGALRNEGVRVIKYEPDLESNLFVMGRNDLLVYRYADVHLMKAECLFRLGQTEEALSMINELRRIRNVSELTSITLDDILKERGFELYWEGWRRQDLVRFARFTDSWEHKAANEEFHNIFPIPQTALEANPELVQNPGY